MSLFQSNTVLVLVTLGALSLIPVLFMTTTSFVKMHVVFSILRNALGVGQVPSNLVVAALAAILSLYVMTPVGLSMQRAVAPFVSSIDTKDPLAGSSADALVDAVKAGVVPLRAFLQRNAGRHELELFYGLAQKSRPEPDRADVKRDDILVILPAFLLTELAEAFQIGFLVFLPFLIVDMVVANVLLALGMHMLSPTTVSLPFKLLLFVLVDGWYLLARALVLGYS